MAKNLFWPVSKFNTDSLPLRGILLVKTRSAADADKPARRV